MTMRHCDIDRILVHEGTARPRAILAHAKRAGGTRPTAQDGVEQAVIRALAIPGRSVVCSGASS